MPRVYIDLTDDEQYWNGKICLQIAQRDSLTGADHSLVIGEEVEIVLSTPQAVTLFDVLDGWLHEYPVKAVGDIERRIREALKETVVEHGSAVRAINARPEELAKVIYDNMKIKGLRFRLAGEQH